jgi:tetratricopeptide (TPR) repeat protein
VSTAAEHEDLYAVLGLTRTASAADIKAAYFRNVRRHPPEKDAEGFRRVHAAYEILRNDKTRKEYDETQKTDPEARALYDRGRQLLEDGKAAEALPLIKRALVRQPDSPVVRDLMTQALIAEKQYEEAEKQARRVLALVPDNPTYSIRVGDILRDRDHDAEALPHYRRALALDRANGQIVVKLAYLLNYLDQTPEAVSLLEEGIASDGRVDFEDFIYFQCLYTIFTGRERYQDLKTTRTRIRAILPPDPEQRSFVAWFYYHNALLMAERGNFEAAVQSIEEAGSIDSSLPDLAETVERLRTSRKLRDELQRLGEEESFDIGLKMCCVTLGFRFLLGTSDELKEMFDKAFDVLNNAILTEGANIGQQIRTIKSRYPALAEVLDEFLKDIAEADAQTPKEFIRLVCPNCGDKARTSKPTVQNLSSSGLSAYAAQTLLRTRGERGILQLLTFSCDKCYASYNGLSQRTAPVAPQPAASSGCFVVTAAYGDENAYPVRALRAYRDRTLAAYGWGRLLMRVYQVVGPVLARWIVLSPALRELARRACERLARRLDPEGR